MAAKKTSVYYMKLCRDALHEIYMLPRDQGAAFIRLKRKAAKYLEKAKELKALEDAET